MPRLKKSQFLHITGLLIAIIALGCPFAFRFHKPSGNSVQSITDLLASTNLNSTNDPYAVPAMAFLEERETLNPESSAALVNQQILILGDSILRERLDAGGIGYLLEQLTGAIIYNLTVGGSEAGYGHNSYRADDDAQTQTFFNLAKAIAYNDPGLMDGGLDYEVNGNYLFDIDFSDLDCLIIEFGTNDMFGDFPINSSDPYDTYTYIGALRSGIKILQESYPNLKILLLTPPQVYLEVKPISERKHFKEQYAAAAVDLAKEMGISSLDIFTVLPINEDNYSQYLFDGVHPNEYGYQLYAQVLSEKLIEMLTIP